jgi:hypothetical protein
MKSRTRTESGSSSSTSLLDRMGATRSVDPSALFGSELFCVHPQEPQRTISSPFEVPFPEDRQQPYYYEEQISPEAPLGDDRLINNNSHLFCLPRTYSSHLHERSFRNSSNFDDSMSSHSEEDDSLEHQSAGPEDEFIGELKDVFLDDFDNDFDNDSGDGSSVLERGRPLLDNVYSLYRESRFSNLNDTRRGADELNSSEARFTGQMEKFELLKAEMTKAANRHADLKKEKQSTNFTDTEEEMRLQELKKKIESELRQDEKVEQVADMEDGDGDSSLEREKENDGHEVSVCAQEIRNDELGQGVEDSEKKNQETKYDADARALTSNVDLAHIPTDDVEVIHVDDGEWTDSDLSDSDGESDTGDCSSSDDSSSSSESEMHSTDGDWVAEALESMALMGVEEEEEEEEEHSDYGGEDEGVSLGSIDLPENTLSFDFREYRAGSNISLLEAIVSDVRALLLEPRSTGEGEDELAWHEDRDFPTLSQDYELETKHTSMTTVKTENTGCSSKATAESYREDSFLQDEGVIATHLFMILLPQIDAGDEVKLPEIKDIADDDTAGDVVDNDDIELLSEEVNLDKHEAILSRRKRLLLRIRRGCLLCSKHS